MEITPYSPLESRSGVAALGPQRTITVSPTASRIDPHHALQAPQVRPLAQGSQPLPGSTVSPFPPRAAAKVPQSAVVTRASIVRTMSAIAASVKRAQPGGCGAERVAAASCVELQRYLIGALRAGPR